MDTQKDLLQWNELCAQYLDVILGSIINIKKKNNFDFV